MRRRSGRTCSANDILVVSTSTASWRPTQRCNRARRIGPVAQCKALRFTGQLPGIHRVTALFQPAPRPCLGRGREEHLEVGVGKHHRADVATIDDHADAGTREFPQLRVDPLTHHRHRRHRRHVRSHRRRAQVRIGGRAVQVAGEPSAVRLEHEPTVFGAAQHRVEREGQRILHPGARRLVQRDMRDGTIQGTRIEVPEAQCLRHGARRARLAGGRRPIDRHNAAAHHRPGTLMPASVSLNRGKLTSAQRMSSILTRAPGTVPSTAKAMARR